MNIIEGLEKLINERGSAAIMKERLQLIQDRYDALQAKLEASEATKAALEAKCSALEEQRDAARAEIAEIRRLQDEADKQRQGNVLDPAAEEMLKLVCFHGGSSVEYLAGLAGANVHVSQHHLDVLLSKRLVRDAYFNSFDDGPQCEWNVTPAGRAYLMERGLLA